MSRRLPVIVVSLATAFALAALPDARADGAPPAPVNWGAPTLDTNEFLAGFDEVLLVGSDYFFDGGSLVFAAQTKEGAELYIGLPNPKAVQKDARQEGFQFVVVAKSQDFKPYGTVKPASDGERKLVAMLERFIERTENLEARPTAWHGQDLVEAARWLITVVQTRNPPKKCGADRF